MLPVNPAVRAAGQVVAATLGARDRALGPRPGVTLVGWHAVANDGDGLVTTFDQFRGHLDTIGTYGTVVALDEPNPPPNAVALTFDDGYAGVAELAWPELKARGWR